MKSGKEANTIEEEICRILDRNPDQRGVCLAQIFGISPASVSRIRAKWRKRRDKKNQRQQEETRDLRGQIKRFKEIQINQWIGNMVESPNLVDFKGSLSLANHPSNVPPEDLVFIVPTLPFSATPQLKLFLNTIPYKTPTIYDGHGWRSQVATCFSGKNPTQWFIEFFGTFNDGSSIQGADLIHSLSLYKKRWFNQLIKHHKSNGKWVELELYKPNALFPTFLDSLPIISRNDDSLVSGDFQPKEISRADYISQTSKKEYHFERFRGNLGNVQNIKVVLMKLEGAFRFLEENPMAVIPTLLLEPSTSHRHLQFLYPENSYFVLFLNRNSAIFSDIRNCQHFDAVIPRKEIMAYFATASRGPQGITHQRSDKSIHIAVHSLLEDERVIMQYLKSVSGAEPLYIDRGEDKRVADAFLTIASFGEYFRHLHRFFHSESDSFNVIAPYGYASKSLDAAIDLLDETANLSEKHQRGQEIWKWLCKEYYVIPICRANEYIISPLRNSPCEGITRVTNLGYRASDLVIQRWDGNVIDKEGDRRYNQAVRS